MLATALLLEDDGLPLELDLVLVKEQARTFDVRVSGLPAGTTLNRLIWTAKVSASDADSLKKFQKVCTLTSDLATIGHIADAGTAGVARATVTFVATDLPDSLPDALVHQMWGEVIDSALLKRVGPCARGAIALSTPIPFTLP